MDRRQRKTVNLFSRYVIDDKAVKISEAATKAAETNTGDWKNQLLGMVTDKLTLDEKDLMALHQDVNFDETKLDRRILFEVAGIRFADDEEDYDSGDALEEDDHTSGGSTSPTNQTMGNAQLIASPLGMNYAQVRGDIPKRKTTIAKAKKKRKIDIEQLNGVL